MIRTEGGRTMAKIAPNVQKAAGMAGIKAPPVKAPKLKTADQLKKEAAAEGKKRAKRLVKVLIVAAVAAAIALVIYFVKFYGKQPKDMLAVAAEAASHGDLLAFRNTFTEDSIAFVENAEGDSKKNWEHLMDGLCPTSELPSVKKQEITEVNDIKNAELTVLIEGKERKIFMRQEEGTWRINLNVALNPNPKNLPLPDDIPPEYVNNFNVSGKTEAWWEDSDKKEDEEKSSGVGSYLKKVSFLRRFFK